MSHDQRCKDANRFGDGFECIGPPRCAHGVPVDAREAVPAPSPQPEMPEGVLPLSPEEEDWFFGNGYGHSAGATEVRCLLLHLERMGLAIVPAAEVTTPEERAVLDAWPLLSEDARESALTELARRKP
jgi:hypothetical protein